MDGAHVSVVIITRDRLRSLLTTLTRLDALPERPDVVLVDQGSQDGTPAAVRRGFPHVRVLELEHDRGAAGRTVGARVVRTPYVAFCDDDSWWAPGALSRAAALLDAHPGLGGIAGRVLLGPEGRLDPACAAMATSPLAGDLPGPRVLGFVACGAIVRRAPYLAVGGFDPRLRIGGEEQLLATDLAARGWPLVYRHDVVAFHHPSALRDRAARRAMQVRNDLWFAWLRRHRGHVVRVTGAALRAAAGERAARAGLVRAVAGAPGVLGQRRPVPDWLERDFRALDRTRVTRSG